jgi:hypothetical protein
MVTLLGAAVMVDLEVVALMITLLELILISAQVGGVRLVAIIGAGVMADLEAVALIFTIIC